ncbi:unnamed protein product [Ilex paraguariensis]|uniref:CRAL-TRIO domain-containing protein n=1 Tax=Ilex paraguariensis TaxID=185542 RepID=A0ABC8T548_9AQUA
MGDSFQTPGLIRNYESTSSRKRLIASAAKSFSPITSKQIASIKHGRFGRGTAAQVALFLLKIAALEMVRRFSRARCPFLWSGLQVLQVLCYSPFKWIQRWKPLKVLVKGMKVLSRPLLVLSITTAFSDQSGSCNVTSDGTEDSIGLNDSPAVPESHAEFPSVQSTLDTRTCDEAQQNLSSPNWLLRLHAELGKQGISLPERINEDELHRFYNAANGDFPCMLSSVKKTIRWRETYRILSRKELKMWSSMVFWHGVDLSHRPCLIVRLGLACIGLPSNERPRFVQAVVSQVEHGILHLVDSENPQITVLVDCERLSPLRLPMQMVRTCSVLLQDHFPNRLGSLFVIRLPPVVRIMAQTFIQVLKPVTRQKVKVEGEMYQNVLSEYLQTLPSYLGGECTCMTCGNLNMGNMQQPCINGETNEGEANADFSSGEDLLSLHPSSQTDMHMNNNCDQVLRSAMVGILIFSVLIAFFAGFFDPETRPVLPPLR